MEQLAGYLVVDWLNPVHQGLDSVVFFFSHKNMHSGMDLHSLAIALLSALLAVDLKQSLSIAI